MNLTENFDVVWQTKHKNDLQIVFQIPIGSSKKWYEFWKKENTPEKTTIILMDKEEDYFNKTNEIWVDTQ